MSSVAELADAIEADRLSGLKGFGAKTAENLRHGIELLRRGGGRVLISMAMAVAEETVTQLSACPGAWPVRTRARCAGCGRASATWTSSPRPATRSR